jgi:hypothetical protein
MPRLFSIVIAILALLQSIAVAAAHDFLCTRSTCFIVRPPHERHHGFYFHPQLEDGLPLVQGFRHQLDDYHGVACIWIWHRVATPDGFTRVLAPDCHSY